MKTVLILNCVFFSVNIYPQPIDKKTTSETLSYSGIWKNYEETMYYLDISMPQNMFHCLSGDTDKFDSKFVFSPHLALVGMYNYGDMGRNRHAQEVAAAKLKIVSDYV